MGPLGRTGGRLGFDRGAGLPKDGSLWQSTNPTASSSSVDAFIGRFQRTRRRASQPKMQICSPLPVEMHHEARPRRDAAVAEGELYGSWELLHERN